VIRKAGLGQEIPIAKGIHAPATFNRKIRVRLFLEGGPALIMVQMMILDYPSDGKATFLPRWVRLSDVVPRAITLDETESHRFALASPGGAFLPIVIVARQRGRVYFATARSIQQASSNKLPAIRIFAADEQLVRRIEKNQSYSELMRAAESMATCTGDTLHGPEGITCVHCREGGGKSANALCGCPICGFGLKKLVDDLKAQLRWFFRQERLYGVDRPPCSSLLSAAEAL
jgi:hypothetical protein